MTRGPKPKENAIRRNKHEYAQTLSSSTTEGRALPPGLGIKTAGARRFWRTWATSPQASNWAETDWAELEITVKLVDAFYGGDVKLAGEIRQRVAKWGATTEDRSRLRISLEETGQDQGDEPDSPDPATSDLDEELFRLLSD
ncbi:phage terminase small subunit [Streptomyces rubiginosohelvolus]|uniref:phage terminase small subunit n=1 Tax=Streptomyces rubiginosohelvolus TaxID=67362 RepID=UPI0036510706